jgi:ABC-type multidrug transport system fused ATPase/permease subunit
LLPRFYDVGSGRILLDGIDIRKLKQEALAGQETRRTTIIVAQRISTVLGADRIVLLEKGRMVAEGTHQELMRESGIYREIFISQLGEGVDREIGEAEGESPEVIS